MSVRTQRDKSINRRTVENKSNRIDSADTPEKFKYHPSIRSEILLLSEWRGFLFRLLRRPKILFRSRGKRFFITIAESFPSTNRGIFRWMLSDRKSIRVTGRNGGYVEWRRIAYILGYRPHRSETFSLLSSTPLLSSSFFFFSLAEFNWNRCRRCRENGAQENRARARHDKSRYPTRYHLASTNDGWQILSRPKSPPLLYTLYTEFRGSASCAKSLHLWSISGPSRLNEDSLYAILFQICIIRYRNNVAVLFSGKLHLKLNREIFFILS